MSSSLDELDSGVNNAGHADSDSDVEQTHGDVVLDKTWWWAAHLSLCAVAIVANVLFLVTVIYNRKRHDLKTFVSAVIVTISVLDVVDVLRILPVLVESLFKEEIFRHVFCSLGVFHELAVALFIVSLSIAVCCQAGKEPKFFQGRRSACTHQTVIALVLLSAAGAAAPFFLLPYDRITYACVDPFRAVFVLDSEADSFYNDLYSTIVTVFTYLIPLLIVPIAIPVASVRTCIARQCCAARYKQPIGELLLVAIVATVYFATVVGVVLPKLQSMFKMEIVELGPAPLLWELGNNAARPLVYFLTNPAVWDGLRVMCCRRKHQLVNERDDDEIENGDVGAAALRSATAV